MASEDRAVSPWMVALAVILPTFMEVLDTSIASVALPHIAGSLSASVDEATWVLTSYLVANAVVLPASSWFSLRFGRKRFLITCIVIFTIASFACGAATSLGMILMARAIQGAGGGALQPLSQAILLESFPQTKRGLAMAVFGLGVVVAPVLGPTLGGWLTDTYSWRWAFYINIPVGALAIVMIMRYVSDPHYIRNARVGKIDKIGFGLLAIWLAILQIILDKGQEDDWFSANWIRWGTGVLIVTFVAFVIWEWNRHQPLVNLRIFRERSFAVGCLLIAMFGGVIYGLVTLLPIFYQTLLGYTALTSGIAVSPRGLGAIVAMPVIGILTSRIDNRYLIAFGFALFAGCSMWFAHINLGITQWTLTWAIILSGFGSGCVFVPLSTAAMARLPNEQIGNASGLYNLLRNIGGGIGISMINTVLARHEQIHRAELVHNITPGNPVLQAQLHGLTGYLQNAPVQSVYLPAQRALDLVNLSVAKQSALLSFVDDFRYLAVVCVFCLPFVFLLQKTVGKKGSAASAAH